MWENHGHAQIEVRGLAGDRPRDDRLPSRVKSAVGRLSGVRWAEINAVTGQVMVAFDQRRVDLETVLDTVRSVENAAGTRHEDFPWERPVHPSDITPLASALVELAADWVALNAAFAGRILRVPALPRGVRVGLTLLDLQPQPAPPAVGADRSGEHRRADVADVLRRPRALPAADRSGAQHGPADPAARARSWPGGPCGGGVSRSSARHRRGCRTRLQSGGPDRNRCRPVLSRPGRIGSDPAPSPARLGVLLLTREPRRAADTILAAVPRAARLGRESFAATAARRLARRGVVPLDASAYRRLDRMSAIFLDSEVLCSDRPQILAAEAEGSGDAACPVARRHPAPAR